MLERLELPSCSKWILAEADVVITVSQPLADWAGQFRQGPTVVIQNGFEPAWFANPAEHSPDNQLLTFLGHPKPWHGTNRLPTLVAQLNQRGYTPQVLVIGGGVGADELRSQAKTLGVEDQIEITGAVAPEEASRLVATAAIGLAPYPTQPDFYFSTSPSWWPTPESWSTILMMISHWQTP